MVKWLFEKDDEVEYSHPIHGKGRGIIKEFNEKQTKIFVIPKSMEKRKKCDCLVCSPKQLILTPF